MEKPLILKEPPPRRPSQTPAPRGGFLLARPFGIEVRLDASWIAIAILILLSLGNQFGHLFPKVPVYAVWLYTLGATLVFFLSLLLHEFSHSLVARARGLQVQGITLFVFGGISQIRGEPQRPKDEFLIAIVGPLTSAALGLVFLILGQVLGADTPAAFAAGWLSLINFLLAGFNLLPGYPLDGGRVFRAIAWALSGNLRRATRLAARLGVIIGGGLIVWGAFRLFGSTDFISGIWLGLIGWFLVSAAQRSVMNLELREILGGYRVKQIMRSECPRVRADENVKQFVEERVIGTGQRCFLVTEGDALKGLVTLHEVKSVGRDAWAATTLGDIMVPLDRVESVSPSDSLMRVLEKMEERGIHQLPVLEDGALRGLVTREDVLRVLTTDLELRGSEA